MAHKNAPMVRSPAGSTCRARCSASEVARSALAGVTARMIALSPCKADGSNDEDLWSEIMRQSKREREGSAQLVLRDVLTLMYVRAMSSRSWTMDFGCPSMGTFVSPALMPATGVKL